MVRPPTQPRSDRHALYPTRTRQLSRPRLRPQTPRGPRSVHRHRRPDEPDLGDASGRVWRHLLRGWVVVVRLGFVVQLRQRVVRFGQWQLVLRWGVIDMENDMYG